VSVPTKQERRTAFRRRLLLAGWLMGGAVILARAAELQVVEGADWHVVAEGQHRKTVQVPASRGAILDRNAVPMAVSRERVRVSVAPHELANADQAAGLLSEALELSPRKARAIVGSSRRWVVVAGHYSTAVREILSGVPGIYLERSLPRFYPHGDLVRAVLGSLQDGRGADGVEAAYDSILRGRDGQEIQARDSRGAPVPGETVLVQAPESGSEVVLTLDLDLQEIAHEALSAAVEETGSRGGDLLITDPSTGEILAMVSLPSGTGTGMSSLTTPYEPGSTLKPFTVAAILNNGVATMDDSVDTGVGSWRVAGRTLNDVHPQGGYLTLGDALRVSSNVGIAKLAQGLSPAEQYENLRDFGFGVSTGIGIAGEASGTVVRAVPCFVGHRIRDLRHAPADGHGIRGVGQRWEADGAAVDQGSAGRAGPCRSPEPASYGPPCRAETSHQRDHAHPGGGGGRGHRYPCPAQHLQRSWEERHNPGLRP